MPSTRLATLIVTVLVAMTIAVVAAKAYGLCISSTVLTTNAKRILNATYTFAVAHNITANTQFRTLYNITTQLLNKAETYLREGECSIALRYSVAALRAARKLYVISILLTKNATSKAISSIVNAALSLISRWINRTEQIFERHEHIMHANVTANVTKHKMMLRHIMRNMRRELRRCMIECRIMCKGNASCMFARCIRACEYRALRDIARNMSSVDRVRTYRFILHIMHRLNRTAIMPHKWSKIYIHGVHSPVMVKILVQKIRVLLTRLERLKLILNELLRHGLITKAEKEKLEKALNYVKSTLSEVEEKLAKMYESATRHHVTSKHSEKMPGKMPHTKTPTRSPMRSITKSSISTKIRKKVLPIEHGRHAHSRTVIPGVQR